MTPPAWRIHDKPVIVPGQLHGPLDAKRAGACHVIQLGDRYRMVYWGSDAEGHHILAAESPVDRPNDWKPLGPLLSRQPETVFNHFGPSFPFLLPVDEKRWLLYFACWGKNRADGKLANTTAVAVSDDGGKTFRYHDANPIIPLDRPYDREGTGSIGVERDTAGGKPRFRMWYTALGSYIPKPPNVSSGHGENIPHIGIAYAESSDGLTWEKPLDDWCVRPRGFGVEPYEYICSKPAILRNPGGGYTLWVNTFGTAYRIHRLTSANGTDWKWGERVGADGELGAGAKGAYDDFQRSYPTMVRHGNELRCWFTGNSFGCHGMGYATQTIA